MALALDIDKPRVLQLEDEVRLEAEARAMGEAYTPSDFVFDWPSDTLMATYRDLRHTNPGLAALQLLRATFREVRHFFDLRGNPIELARGDLSRFPWNWRYEFAMKLVEAASPPHPFSRRFAAPPTSPSSGSDSAVTGASSVAATRTASSRPPDPTAPSSAAEDPPPGDSGSPTGSPTARPPASSAYAPSPASPTTGSGSSESGSTTTPAAFTSPGESPTSQPAT